MCGQVPADTLMLRKQVLKVKGRIVEILPPLRAFGVT